MIRSTRCDRSKDADIMFTLSLLSLTLLCRSCLHAPSLLRFLPLTVALLDHPNLTPALPPPAYVHTPYTVGTSKPMPALGTPQTHLYITPQVLNNAALFFLFAAAAPSHTSSLEGGVCVCAHETALL